MRTDGEASLAPPQTLAARWRPADPNLLPGLAIGLVAASIGALYAIFARWGIDHGLESSDMTFLRFAVAGVATLPVLALALYRDARALLEPWRAWLAVSLLAGPLFGLLMFTALQWAPASHAALFPFTAISVMSTLMAARWLGDRLTLRKVAGIAIVVVGLVVLSGFDPRSLTGRAPFGDVLFLMAGTLWAGFGIVMRKYRLDALLATAVVSFVALLTYVPVYLAVNGTGRLNAASATVFWTEVVIQGLIAGAGSLYTYSRMVALLGAARAAVFPALAPGIAALLAWPVLGHVPSPLETTGLVIAVIGLLITVTARSPRLAESAA